MEHRWVQFVRATMSSNSRLHKLAVVPQYEDLSPLWRLIFCETTGVTTSSIEKYGAMPQSKRRRISEWVTIKYDLMDTMGRLCSRRLSGHAAQMEVQRWLKRYPEYRHELLLLFSGKPRLGLDVEQINRALVGAGHHAVCEVFKVALAHPFKDSRLSEPHDQWFITRKYDGVRGIMFWGPGGARVVTRHGNKIRSLTDFCASLPPAPVECVLDGELCVLDDGGDDDFGAAVSRLRNDREQVVDFRFKVFEFLTPDEFRSGTSRNTWSHRMVEAADAVKAAGDDRLELVQYERYGKDAMTRWQQKWTDGGWEGLMLRRDTTYKGKRTWDMMKVKTFHTAEYVVMDIVTGIMGVLNAGTGRKVDRTVMSSVVVSHKGEYVSVGSGFTMEQRIEFFEHPDRIIGQTVEVQYFEETVRDGRRSLRFPTVKHLWGDKRYL